MTHVSQAKSYLMKKSWLLLLICIQTAPIASKKSPNVGQVHSSSKYHESFENSHEISKSIKSSDRNATKIEHSGSENEEDQIECSGGENDNRDIGGSTKDENKRQKGDKNRGKKMPKHTSFSDSEKKASTTTSADLNSYNKSTPTTLSGIQKSSNKKSHSRFDHSSGRLNAQENATLKNGEAYRHIYIGGGHKGWGGGHKGGKGGGM